MIPSKYENPALSDFPIKSGWKINKLRYQEKVMFLRLNSAAKAYIGHPGLPMRAGVAVRLHRPTKDGLPATEEALTLAEIEDALCNELQPAALGFLVAVITTNRMREFLFYIHDESGINRALLAAEKCANGHKLQNYVKEDKTWAAYQHFL